MTHRRVGTGALAAGAGGLLGALRLPATAAAAQPGGGGCEKRAELTYDRLLECVTLEGVQEHLQALQDIATKSADPVHPGTRAAGTEGYGASVDYVTERLEKAGYEGT